MQGRAERFDAATGTLDDTEADSHWNWREYVEKDLDRDQFELPASFAVPPATPSDTESIGPSRPPTGAGAA